MRPVLVTALLLLGACSAKPAAPPPAAVVAPPDWSGVWINAGREVNIDGFTPVDPSTMAGPPPATFVFSAVIPWNDAGKAKFQAIMTATHGDPGNNAANAAGWGYPLMMTGPAALQFVNAPGVTIIMNLYRDTRQIYTDGRAHLPAEEEWPATTWGDSIGHWEGDTLVIDTVGVRSPELYFAIAAPYSEKAHYVERLRLAAPDRIEGEMTIEDPATLTMPVKIPLSFVRSKEVERMVFDSFSNDRSGWDGKFNTIETKAK